MQTGDNNAKSFSSTYKDDINVNESSYNVKNNIAINEQRLKEKLI